MCWLFLFYTTLQSEHTFLLHNRNKFYLFSFGLSIYRSNSASDDSELDFFWALPKQFVVCTLMVLWRDTTNAEVPIFLNSATHL